MPRKYWNFPSFNPDRLSALTLKRATVLHWLDRSTIDICLNVEQSLRNEFFSSGYFVSRKLNVGFERSPNQRFFIKRLQVVESSIIVTVSMFEPHLARFKKQEPLLFSSVKVVESRLVVAEYHFDQLTAGGMFGPPDDIPF